MAIETLFVGRSAEMAALQALLSAPDVRLVTVTGVAGSGKTRLVDEIAAVLDGEWPGAVVTVPLAGVDDPALIPSVLLQHLDVTPAEGTSELDSLAEALDDVRALLILDNLEQLGAEGADQVWDLLEAIPTAVCLCTSRANLGLPGERTLPLGPLPVPSAEAPAEQMLAADSVRMYLDRVTRVDPAFQPTPEACAAIAELCTKLDGLPLAIELAAGCVRSVPIRELLARWDERFELLGAADSDTGRHRSLQAALAWSFDLLSPRHREFFARLSVFRGSWTLEAAEQVCDEPMAAILLEDLRNASLIQVFETGVQLRFRLLETLRDYGALHLVRMDEVAAALAAHLRYYRSFAAEGAARLEQDGEQREWLERFDSEQENLRAALSFAFDSDAGLALALAGSLWRYWLVRGRWHEGCAWLEKGLAAPDQPPAVRARALNWLGHLWFRLGAYNRATTALEESLALSEADEDRAGTANALNELGKVHWARGEYQQARRCYEVGLATRRAIGNLWGVAASLGNLGAVAAATGDTAQAIAYIEEGLVSRRELGDRRGIAASLNNLGGLAFAQYRHTDAERYLAESLAIRTELDDQPGIAAVLNDLGALHHVLARLATAREQFERSLAIRRELGDRRGIAITLCNLGSVACDQGELEMAADRCRESVASHREMGDKRGLARALTTLGDVLNAAGDLAEAQGCQQEALEIQTQIGDQRGIALSLANLGDTATQFGHFAEAEALFERARIVATELNDTWLHAVVTQGRGRLMAASGRGEEALDCLAASLKSRFGLSDRRWLAPLMENLASVLCGLEQSETAALWLGAAQAERAATQMAHTPRQADESARVGDLLATRLGRARLTALELEGGTRGVEGPLAELTAGRHRLAMRATELL